MSIVATEVTVVYTAPTVRALYYRCQDHLGAWHPYGPVITSDADFDAEAFKVSVAGRIAESLADHEFDGALR